MMKYVHLRGHLKILNTVIEQRGFDLYLSLKKGTFFRFRLRVGFKSKCGNTKLMLQVKNNIIHVVEKLV